MATDIHYPPDRFAICASPDPTPRPPTRFKMPPGAVDTHAHVIGPAPYIESRMYTPSPATAEQYLRMLDAVGTTYGVLIQVSVHGNDNSVMLDCLKANSQRLRGVAMAPYDLPDQDLQRLRDAGVTGLRMNAAAGNVALANLDRYEAICAELGWHLQFITTAAQLGEIAPRLTKLRVPAVIDHMGHFSVSDGANSPTMRLMLSLVSDGAWVKLSGAFRVSTTPPYTDTVPFARALINAAPDRCVWGSDWPHIAFTGKMPNVGELLDLLADWAPDEIQRRRILVDNPHRLYGFDPNASAT